MQDLRVSLIQSKLHWEDIAQNLSFFAEKMKHLKGETDLIVLPEMFTTGFTMNAEHVAESMGGLTMDWLKQQAVQLDSAIVGSFIVSENGNFYNRLIFIKPDGAFSFYDKRHLFTLAKEHHTFTAGKERIIVEWKGWKICPLICYDLRFPVWSRNTESYDLLIYVANWPETRALHWKSLLIGRAIENQSFTIGVNRVGVDGKGFTYSGDSALVDYSGDKIYSISKEESVFTCALSKSAQEAYRTKLNFLPDQDSFKVL